jgi:hypothetical protein
MEVPMRRFTGFAFLALCLLLALHSGQAQTRMVLDVPKVDPGTITIDGVADEAAWNSAARADIITNVGFQGWFNYYGRTVVEPDYPELWGRMLWTTDTLYVFIHIQDVVNDSSGLYWNTEPYSHWSGDQLFVDISSRLGIPMGGNYDGNVYAAPEGPYHFLVLGDRVTLNNGDTTDIPEEWRKDPNVTRDAFDASKICRYAAVIDTMTGQWDVEMAIYQPSVVADSRIGFDIGGSQGSRSYGEANSDAYAYWCWEPSVDNDPFAVPPLGAGAPGDPGGFNLINSDYWPILHFTPGASDIVRMPVNVPRIDPSMLTIDGVANEPAWNGAAKADIITNIGFQGWFNYYGRTVVEPDYPELWGRMLWATDTLYVFVHIQDVVNDSSGLYWNTEPYSHWSGDQLFIDISSRLGIPMGGNYDGNVYAAPEGPYHFLVLGDRVTLNNGDTTGIPEEWRKDPAVTQAVFDASTICRYATVIDTLTGQWDVEMAIYQPSVVGQTNIGFDIGGSQGSRSYGEANSDAYAYWCWEPSVDNDPFAVPPLGAGAPGDPGGFNLINSDYWPMLNFDTTLVVTSVREMGGSGVPTSFLLNQNYPNPFNPSTNISYEVPGASRVTLVVYNVLGQTVATLVDQQQPAGRYSLSWNASNLSSGIYFLQLKADGKPMRSKKMMLLK